MGRKRWLIPTVVVTFLVAMMVGPSQTHAVRLAAEACDADRFLLQVLRSGMVLALPPTCEVCRQASAEWFAPTLGSAGRLLCPGCMSSTELGGGVLGKARK
jgi:hypothetical protein